jgi:outer membrane receptor protein involved in Fe transport
LFGYDSPSQPWGGNISFNFVAAVDEPDVIDPASQYLPDSHTTVNLNLHWLPISQIQLRAGVKNLTNAQYERWSKVRNLGPDNFDDLYSEPGRNWTLSFKYQF